MKANGQTSMKKLTLDQIGVHQINTLDLFFSRPSYRRRCSHTRAHTHPYECTHTHPTPISTFEELSWTGKSRD
jgi:hypothetical protein